MLRSRGATSTGSPASSSIGTGTAAGGPGAHDDAGFGCSSPARTPQPGPVDAEAAGEALQLLGDGRRPGPAGRGPPGDRHPRLEQLGPRVARDRGGPGPARPAGRAARASHAPDRPPARAPCGTAFPARPGTRPGRPRRPRTRRRPPACARGGTRPWRTGPTSARRATVIWCDRVDERLLVLLEVPVVGERQPLQGHQQPGQVPDEPTRLAPGQLGHVGVLLLGQHRAAGGVGVGERAEAELLGRPQHDLLPHPREVHAEQGDVEERLGHEVAVGDGVERVLEPCVEAEVLGHEVGVERQRGPGQGPGPERARRPSARRWRSAGRRRGRAPTRGPAGGGPAAPAGPAAGGCSRAGRRRRPRSARPSSTSWSAMTSVATPVRRRRHHRRRSVATWSLRLRPVCSLAPTSPASSVTRRSMAVCTSSSPAAKTKRPSATSSPTRSSAASRTVDLALGQHARRGRDPGRGRATRRGRRRPAPSRTRG